MIYPRANFAAPHGLPGALIVVEGVDGSGKSTQLQLLDNFLRSLGYGVLFSEWNSSELVSAAIKKAKKKGRLTPRTFCLLHAVDFADRINTMIRPALEAGMIVLCDRYCYTAFARDVSRGLERAWVRKLYNFAIRPDAAFYFRVPVEVSLSRILTARVPNFYEAGMDLHLSPDPIESYRIFQGRNITEYDEMVLEYGIHLLDATLPIHPQQEKFRQIVSEEVLSRLSPRPSRTVRRSRAHA